jgi:hypothetical protein
MWKTNYKQLAVSRTRYRLDGLGITSIYGEIFRTRPETLAAIRPPIQGKPGN